MSLKKGLEKQAAIEMNGQTFSCLKLCFSVLWLVENVRSQGSGFVGSENICELAVWFVTKIVIDINSSEPQESPKKP